MRDPRSDLRSDLGGDLRKVVPWLLVGVAGALLAAWAFPHAFPFFPQRFEVTPSEAKAIATEYLRELAATEIGADAWPEDPFVTVDRLTGGRLVERRLQEVTGEIPLERLRASDLAAEVFQWRVTIYPDGAFPNEWEYRALVGPDGRVLAALHRVEPDLALPSLEPAAAVKRADELLTRRGFDLSRYAPPEPRAQQLRNRTDLAIRYRALEAVLGEESPYGMEVRFAGDRLTGYDTFYELEDDRPIRDEIQAVGLWDQLQFVSIYLLLVFVAVVFVRRYHAGEVGVKRGLRIFGTLLVVSLVLVVLISRGLTEGQNWGIFTRQQLVWMWGLQFLAAYFFPHALSSFLSWSVGESVCRERWGHKLAGFDALLQGEWDNATVARASLRGLGAGLGLLGGILALIVLAGPLGVMPQVGVLLGELATGGPLPGLVILTFAILTVASRELYGRLFLLSYVARKVGLVVAVVLSVVITGLLLFPFVIVLPLAGSLAFALLASALLTALFLAYDLLTVLIASFVLQVGMPALALIFTDSSSLQVQGWLVLAVAALPAVLSIRHLGSGREFVYRWDDVPPHVRRIAERERQRVELETARRIQSSILPELPPSLGGVAIAHAYLPATEVGGDFYDVLALEDGRLSVALGDVAGHGVSSGLVMAAAKSALGVQVTFDPDVPAVFGTLNRLVYQSARRRLIATLCYALLDPAKRELVFASAGHLYPYVVSPDGRVRDLASIAYPLGVRPNLEVAMVRESLESGDTVVMLSDGVVEARAEGSAELYGFERLEAALSRLAPESVERMRDGLLEDVNRFSRHAPREDDQTLLVLRLP